MHKAGVISLTLIAASVVLALMFAIHSLYHRDALSTLLARNLWYIYESTCVALSEWTHRVLEACPCTTFFIQTHEDASASEVQLHRPVRQPYISFTPTKARGMLRSRCARRKMVCVIQLLLQLNASM